MKKEKTTAADLAPTTEADSAAAAAFKLDPHLVKLMWDEPFFSSILRKVSKIRSTSIPTAGVTTSNGDIRMLWNPKFLASLTASQVKGLLKHECYHLIFEHTTTRRHEPHLVWNWATDLAINSMIPKVELPEGGLIPGEAFPALKPEQIEKMNEEAQARYDRLSLLIASLELGMSSEEYFAILMNDEQAREDIEGAPGECPGNMDDHEGWDDMSDEERDFVKSKVKQALADSIDECDKKGQWGSVSAETRRQLRELVANEIPWQSILRQFVGQSRRSQRHSTIRRVHRKYPGVHPGVQKGYTSSIAVYIDQSGSVTDNDLEALFAELRSLAKRTEFTCYHFDSEVDEESETVWRPGRTPQTHRTRFGGTCFKAVAEHAQKNRGRFDGYIVLTDGYASDPGPSSMKRGWVIVPDGTTQVPEAHKRDVIIKMKSEAHAA